jgi:peptide/nickel transport system permease protein
MSIDFRGIEEPEALSEFKQPLTPTSKRLTRGQLIRRRFFRNRSAVVGLIIIGALVLLALFGQFLLSWQFDQRDVGQYYKAPSARHLFGTT